MDAGCNSNLLQQVDQVFTDNGINDAYNFVKGSQ